jgi:pimeloyl-ACP methyl ester carboxylesterase
MQTANDIAKFIEQMKLDSVSIIGKSDGAIIALLMGIYFPQKISKIVSFSANLTPDSNALIFATVKDIHEHRMQAEKKLSEKDTSANWKLEKLKYRLMEFQPHIKAADLRKINMPVLVLSTDRDVIKAEHTLFIYQNIPLSHLCIIPGENHFIPRKNPALFNSMVEKFLTEGFKDNSFRFKK